MRVCILNIIENFFLDKVYVVCCLLGVSYIVYVINEYVIVILYLFIRIEKCILFK